MPLAPGKMYRPTDIAVDVATNSVYVVEQFNHRISKWDYTTNQFDFTLDTTWGDKNPTDGTSGIGGPSGDGGPTDGNLYRPSGIVFENNRLTVTDTFHNRIRTLNASTGAFIASVGQGGSGITDFYHPAGIATNGIILVIADEINHRAIKYDVGGTPSSPALLPDPTPLAFNRPHGVVFDEDTNDFNVTDSVRGVISRYNTAATSFIEQFGTPGVSGTDLFFPGSGHGEVNGTLTTIFADTRNSILKTVNATTIDNTTGTTKGIGDGQLYFPESATAFLDNVTSYVLAANTLNNRVEAFDNGGTISLAFQANFGSPHV